MEFTEPRPLRLTAEEYYKLCESEVMFTRRVQLIGGHIFEIPCQSNWYALGVSLTADTLRSAFGSGYWVRVKASLDVAADSVPDPDLAVVAEKVRPHLSPNNPTTALLIVEVAEKTLAFDRGPKANLYAAAAIADYWIVNIPDSQLEVYRDPLPDASQAFGFRYDSRTILVASDFVTPLALPSGRIAVADLLP